MRQWKGFDLRAVAEAALRFRDERDWGQFHTPANLAKGLVVEAAELLEHFLWSRGAAEEATAAEKRKDALADELADVAVFLIYLAHDLQIDLNSAIQKKLAKNGEKYPVAKAKGSAVKYTEL